MEPRGGGQLWRRGTRPFQPASSRDRRSCNAHQLTEKPNTLYYLIFSAFLRVLLFCIERFSHTGECNFYLPLYYNIQINYRCIRGARTANEHILARFVFLCTSQMYFKYLKLFYVIRIRISRVLAAVADV